MVSNNTFEQQATQLQTQASPFEVLNALLKRSRPPQTPETFGQAGQPATSGASTGNLSPLASQYGQVMGTRVEPGDTAGTYRVYKADGSYDTINEEWLQATSSMWQNPSAENAAWVGGMRSNYSGVPYDYNQAPQAATPATPKLDVFNPGAYLASLLRGQRPGWVFNTQVPRPGDIRLVDWVNMNQTQKDVLASYWSALGIPPQDALAEMTRFWLRSSPVQTPRFLY